MAKHPGDNRRRRRPQKPLRNRPGRRWSLLAIAEGLDRHKNRPHGVEHAYGEPRRQPCRTETAGLFWSAGERYSIPPCSHPPSRLRTRKGKSPPLEELRETHRSAAASPLLLPKLLLVVLPGGAGWHRGCPPVRYRWQVDSCCFLGVDFPPVLLSQQAVSALPWPGGSRRPCLWPLGAAVRPWLWPSGVVVEAGGQGSLRQGWQVVGYGGLLRLKDLGCRGRREGARRWGGRWRLVRRKVAADDDVDGAVAFFAQAVRQNKTRAKGT